MKQTILTKQIKAGSAEVWISDGYDGPTIGITAAGKYIGSWSLANGQIKPLDKPVTASNGSICTFGLAGRLMLTADEAATVQAAKDTAKAAYELSEKFIAAKLHSERHTLRCNIAGALDDLSAQRERCYQEDCGFHGMAPIEARIAAAEKALAAFDAEHPEVIAAIKAEEKESVERNMWN